MKYVVEHQGEDIELELRETEDGCYEVIVADKVLKADFHRIEGESIFSLIIDGHSFQLLVSQDDDFVNVVNQGRGIPLRVESERERNARLIAGAGGAGDGESITAVMPGIVVAVTVAEGDLVEAGQAVAVLEAMKMENEIRAANGGKVVKIGVEPGQTVNAGDLLMELGPLDED